MSRLFNPLYSAALRMKAGELAGVRELADDIAAHFLPRFIVPPQSERDETQPLLFVVDNVPDISIALSRHWRGRDALIDLSYLIDECGRDRIVEWLPALFDRARHAGVRAIPLAQLADLGVIEAQAFRVAMDRAGSLQFAVCVSSGEMIGPEFVTALREALDRVDVAPSACAIIADFHDADFSDPDMVAPIITGALETLQDFGSWRHIIFQGTHYPDKNPAGHGGHEIWPRNEWKAWQLAVSFDPNTKQNMMFGDYAADCAKMVFGGSGGAAIPHYRYATENAWIIERGAKMGSHKQNMQNVCERLIRSGSFAGPGFSSADDYILRTAQGEGPGNATTWRQVNTTHHITRVVADIAKVRGISIVEKVMEPTGVQLSLLS